MKPIPIAQYLNQFGRVEPARVDRPLFDRAVGDRFPRESVLLKPKAVAPPVIDIEARLEEAREQGRQEGFAAAREEAAAALAEHRGALTERENAARLAWQASEYAQFAQKIDLALEALEEKLARSVSRILKPFLIDEQVKQVTQSLSENLAKILSKDAPAVLKITGPGPLLELLREQLSSHPIDVEYVAASNLDVTVEANQTVLKTQLQAWVDHLQSLGE
jgi:hypothetical protein